MRQIQILMQLALTLLAMSSPTLAATVSREVLIRDYRTKTNSSMHVTGTLYDSTAGTWIGTRGEAEGLPTPKYRYDGLPIINRVPLSPKVARLGWPARMAGRLDMIYDSVKTIQRCSGFLVGHRHFLTAAHCIMEPTGWLKYSFCVRPGRNLARDAVGDCYRATRAYVRQSAFSGVNDRSDDDEWALIELDSSIGMELGWARIIPISASVHGRYTHQLGYPFYTEDPSLVDTTSKTDTLCHSWVPMKRSEDIGDVMAWSPDVGAWPGESGSPSFYCKKPDCTSGDVNIVGMRWTYSISSIDSVNSGILAALLKDVRIPTSVHAPDREERFDLEIIGSHLLGSASTAGEWRVLSLDGRSLLSPTFGRNVSVAIDRIPSGVALVVFREPGRAAVVRRWMRR